MAHPLCSGLQAGEDCPYARRFDKGKIENKFEAGGPAQLPRGFPPSQFVAGIGVGETADPRRALLHVRKIHGPSEKNSVSVRGKLQIANRKF
jgi:hypothetical protein